SHVFLGCLGGFFCSDHCIYEFVFVARRTGFLRRSLSGTGWCRARCGASTGAAGWVAIRTIPTGGRVRTSRCNGRRCRASTNLFLFDWLHRVWYDRIYWRRNCRGSCVAINDIHPDKDVDRWTSIGRDDVGLDKIPSDMPAKDTNAAAERHPRSGRRRVVGLLNIYGHFLVGGLEYVIVALADGDLQFLRYCRHISGIGVGGG